MKTKRGDTMGFITLDDRTGRMEVAVFADTYNEYRDKLVKDALLIVEGQVSHDDYSGGLKMRASKVTPLEQARQEQLRSIQLHWHSRDLDNNCTRKLSSILEHYRINDTLVAAAEGDATQEPSKKGCVVVVNYQRADASARIQLGETWRVQPVDELVLKLRHEYGSKSLTLGYDR